MKRVVHFELPYADVKRASSFYGHVFGWRIKDVSMKGMEYHMAHTGPTDEKGLVTEPGFINGGLIPKNDMIKSPVLVMKVEDIHDAIKKTEDHGGKKLMHPVAVGDMGHYAYVEDTETNVIGIWQDKES